MGPTARLDGCRKNCSHRDSITRLSIPLRTAIPSELSRPKTLSGSEFERSLLSITEMRNGWSYSLIPLRHTAPTRKLHTFMYLKPIKLVQRESSTSCPYWNSFLEIKSQISDVCHEAFAFRDARHRQIGQHSS